MNPRMTVLQTVALGHLAIPPMEQRGGPTAGRSIAGDEAGVKSKFAQNVSFVYAGLQKGSISGNLWGMKWSYVITALIALAVVGVLVHTGWGREGWRATPEAAQELAELIERDIAALDTEDEVDAETVEQMYAVVQAFCERQDARYVAEESRLSLLHLACLFKKPELAKSLLAHGAPPNAQRAGEDSPLLLAVNTWRGHDEAARRRMRELVDTLLASGAEFGKSGHDGGDFLTQAAMVCEDEETLLYLLRRGAKPDAETATPLALHGMRAGLAAVLEQREEDTMVGLLHAVARGVCLYDGDFVGCLEELLCRDAKVDEEPEGQVGCTPLYLLARELGDMEEGQTTWAQAVEVCQRLLEAGADAYRRADGDAEYPGFCAYDFLASKAGLLQKLREGGVELPEPQICLRSGVDLLADVCRVAMRHTGAEELAEHVGEIGGVLAPTARMLSHEIYPESLTAAVKLLAKVDAERATEIIEASPLWQAGPPGAAKETVDAAQVGMIEAVARETGVKLSRGFICTQAEAMMAAGRGEEAAGLVELLGRCEDGEADVERYCRDARMAMQAGAYAAKLYAAGLPDARNDGVADWLMERGRRANTAFMRKAMLLTSLERLWYGQMTEEEKEELFGMMREIGATEAAKTYAQIVKNIDKPEELDKLMAEGDEWKYELEVATARYFLEHKDEFETRS